MNWYIVRHGDKEIGEFYNPILKHQDQPLSVKGLVEAKNLSTYFYDKEISKIYVSSYIRTGQTIQFVANQKGLEPRVDPRLNEIDNGLVDGMKPQDFKDNFPDIWGIFIERKADFRFPGGETGKESQARILSFFEEKQAEHKGENIVIVSHDGLIRLLVCSIVGIPVYKRALFKVHTCGIMEVEFQESYQEWKLIRFNQTLP